MKNRNIKLILIALVLCLSVSLGATLAYFSDHEEASGGATLKLGGQTELKEGTDTGKKDIQIKNTGETNMIVRVGIYGPSEMKDVTVKGNWVQSDADGFYYYTKTLAPGDETEEGNLVASMSFSWKGNEAPDYDFEVTVVHEGEQAIYDGDTLAVPDGWDASIVSQIQ